MNRNIDEITQTYTNEFGVAIIYKDKNKDTWGWEVKDNDGNLKSGSNGYHKEGQALEALIARAVEYITN